MICISSNALNLMGMVFCAVLLLISIYATYRKLFVIVERTDAGYDIAIGASDYKVNPDLARIYTVDVVFGEYDVTDRKVINLIEQAVNKMGAAKSLTVLKSTLQG